MTSDDLIIEAVQDSQELEVVGWNDFIIKSFPLEITDEGVETEIEGLSNVYFYGYNF